MAGPLLLLGGGSGIVPLMAMIRHRRAVPSTVPTRLLYSSRAQEEVIYRVELDDLTRRDEGLEVIYTLTRTRPPGWTGYARRIDADLLREVAWPARERPLAYICGPTQFVETAATGLVALGYDSTLVKTERFGQQEEATNRRRLMESQLDGNVVGGLLGEIFPFEMTGALATCGGCGATDPIGAFAAYVHGMGTVVRCPSCDTALIRLSRVRGRYWMDMRGVRVLQIIAER